MKIRTAPRKMFAMHRKFRIKMLIFLHNKTNGWHVLLRISTIQ